MHIANRGNIRPFEVMEAFREAATLEAQGKHIVHLSLGQPGKSAPKPVLEFVADKLMKAPLGYTDARGMPALRERIAAYYKEQYKLDVPVERIFVTVGSSAAYFLALLAAFDSNARLAIARPCYPAYPNMMEALGLTPVFLDASEASGFQPDVPLLKQAGTIDGLVIASPSNPTGSVLTTFELKSLSDYCKAHHIQMISDEIYHHVVYDDAGFDTILRHNDNAIVVNSFSKYFLLPGWRLGWAVMPPHLVRSYESLLQSFFISPPAIAQYAALKTFDHQDELQTTVQDYAVNRDVLKGALESLGFTGLNKAQGAFYLYANIDTFGADSRAFCRSMLHEAGVCAVPGTDFDQAQGHRYVRFSFCGDAADIQEAANRLKTWLST
jgi:aspartate/methionine/tyrosine aminotransferase